VAGIWVLAVIVERLLVVWDFLMGFLFGFGYLFDLFGFGGDGMIGRLQAWLFVDGGLDGSYGRIGSGWVLISFDC
jgi:hypothetical protein